MPCRCNRCGVISGRSAGIEKRCGQRLQDHIEISNKRELDGASSVIPVSSFDRALPVAAGDIPQYLFEPLPESPWQKNHPKRPPAGMSSLTPLWPHLSPVADLEVVVVQPSLPEPRVAEVQTAGSHGSGQPEGSCRTKWPPACTQRFTTRCPRPRLGDLDGLLRNGGGLTHYCLSWCRGCASVVPVDIYVQGVRPLPSAAYGVLLLPRRKIKRFPPLQR